MPSIDGHLMMRKFTFGWRARVFYTYITNRAWAQKKKVCDRFSISRHNAQRSRRWNFFISITARAQRVRIWANVKFKRASLNQLRFCHDALGNHIMEAKFMSWKLHDAMHFFFSSSRMLWERCVLVGEVKCLAIHQIFVWAKLWLVFRRFESQLRMLIRESDWDSRWIHSRRLQKYYATFTIIVFVYESKLSRRPRSVAFAYYSPISERHQVSLFVAVCHSRWDYGEDVKWKTFAWSCKIM